MTAGELSAFVLMDFGKTLRGGKSEHCFATSFVKTSEVKKAAQCVAFCEGWAVANGHQG